ncbi:protoporphyrinogen oxidase [Saccharothrix mutabilis subsp. mutabilis]|uniref:Coproporphyrinogen III oxidase n=1 Tax=Saccharothrix mutabilis subsp. mutabilis TaxID=66855 RepID=A0ABP3E2F2_9PSEU
MAGPQRIAVIGGGISGLATAHFLRAGGTAPEVVVLEADDRLGGKVLTREVAGHRVDTGPDGLLVRAPAMRALVDALGLGPALVTPAAAGAYLWSGSALRRLPAGAQFGLPHRIRPLLRSRLLSPAGLLRAAGDLVLPASALPEDPTVADLVRARFGGQVLDRLVDPLLGGIHAGRADRLSARSTVPDVAALARTSRSLHLALRRDAGSARPGPAFATLRTGLGALVTALAASLDDVRRGTAATALEPGVRGYRVHCDTGGPLEVDAVVLAVPAPAAARLLAPLAPTAAHALAGIPYADVASVVLAYPREAVRRALDGTGFLVPPAAQRLIVGCTWLPAKWSHLADPAVVLVRCSVGRHGDTRWTAFDDRELVARVHRELTPALDLSAPPVHSHVQRWRQGLPQYTVGHAGRLETIDTALRALPGVHVTGAAYRGVGVASCVVDAERTASLLLGDAVPRG